MDELPPPPPYSRHDPNCDTPASTNLPPGPREVCAPKNGPDSSNGNEHGDEHVSFVSGAAYYAMRPPRIS